MPVAGFGWDDVTDAAAGVRNVPGVTWNDVEMELQHGLAGGGAIVEAEVEGVRRRAEVSLQVLLGPVDPDEETSFLRAG